VSSAWSDPTGMTQGSRISDRIARYGKRLMTPRPGERGVENGVRVR
jgi:hypothetical protein